MKTLIVIVILFIGFNINIFSADTTYQVKIKCKPDGVAKMYNDGIVLKKGSNVPLYYTLLDKSYIFVKWTNSKGKEIKLDKEYSLPLLKNEIYTAHFKKNKNIKGK